MRLSSSASKQNIQINQWANFLEALEAAGSSVNTTSEQMTEDLPNELIKGINHELQQRGVSFRV